MVKITATLFKHEHYLTPYVLVSHHIITHVIHITESMSKYEEIQGVVGTPS